MSPAVVELVEAPHADRVGMSVAGIALLNLVAITALGVAYVCHDGLRPMLELRQSRHRAFEQLLTQTPLDTEFPMSKSINAGESREW